MLRIIKAELRYNWFNFTVFLLSVPVLVFVQTRSNTSYFTLVLMILMLFMLNGWNVRYIQEKRDFLYGQLPLAARTVGTARILMILIPSAVFALLYIGLTIAFAPSVHVNFRTPLGFWGLFTIVYSLAFIFRDRLIGTPGLMRGKIIVVALVGAVLILNILTWAAGNRAQGGPPPALLRFFDFVDRNNPAASNLNTVVWVAIALALASVSVITYTRRRSQV